MGLSIKNRWFDEEDRAYIFFSVEEIMEMLNCGRNKAVNCLKELEKENKTRERYYNYYTGQKWGDPQNYDLMINTSRFSPDAAAELILDYIEKRQEA